MNGLALTARILAIAIAIAGVVDPAITSMREGAPDIALVIPSEARDLHLPLRDKLGNDYNIIDGQWDKAAATIIVGNSLPDRIPSGTVFAVRDTSLAIDRFDVPAEVASEARIPIAIGAGKSDVELRANGAVLDRVIPSATRDLHLSPWAPGLLSLEARATRGGDTAFASAITRVVDRTHSILFFDRRPSWMSTFVRRALEADRRFAVASRVVTSRSISTSAGAPPSTLSDPSVLELYDVIVVGTPTQLTSADVAGLDQFLRRRGGAVVLLYDAAPARGPADQLTGVTAWFTRTLRDPVNARAEGDTATALRLGEFAIPERAAGIRLALVTLSEAKGGSSPSRDQPLRSAQGDSAVVWSTSAGRGQVIVSGALDAWKYRDRATSGFDDFWRETVSRAAREASQPVTIEATPNLARPGERIEVRVTTRDTLAQPQVQLDSSALQLWPGDRRGDFVGHFRAPAEGEHWLSVVAGAAKADAPLVVRANVTRAAKDEWSAVTRVARATGGVAGTLDEVVAAVKERVVRESRPERWHPMRSGWWIVPFAVLLGVEWLARRRRGLA